MSLKPRRVALAAGTCVLVVLLAVGLSWRHALTPLDPDAEAQLFHVEAGATLGAVARRLERGQLVRRAWAFEWLARWRDLDTALRAGEYELSASASTPEILTALTEGRVKTYEVGFPEGLTASEIANRLEAAGLAEREAFLAVVRNESAAEAFGVEGPTLEGYLFPETYRLPRGLAAREIAGMFVAQFLAVWEQIAEPAAERELSMQQVATLASIVEKETGAAHERPLIASVFWNRMQRGMRLESDPTVIYGIPDFDGNLRRIHLEDPVNPYNTYRIRGLPPTPIANPGAASLRAVVEPADTNYLYFVSRNDGTHFFSATYREHLAAVNRFQRRRRQ